MYSDDYGICLLQKYISEETKEIPVAQELLGLMDLKGTIVTVDAMNCQKGTEEAVIDGKGDYVFDLKRNKTFFYEEVKALFTNGYRKALKEKDRCYKKTVEAEYGGIATREYYITEDIEWYSEEKKWKGLKSFWMVHKRLKKQDGSQEQEYR